MIKVEPIPAFSDNYIWLVTTNEGSIVIDPGDANPVIEYLNKNKDLTLNSILLTHHHYDHSGGIEDLRKRYDLKVFGPNNQIKSVDHRVVEGNEILVNGLIFKIIEVPGHTLDHIAFYNDDDDDPILFCGDTLFAAGCGRVFEGTFDQMYESLLKLKKLPENTIVYSGHEYTTANLMFASHVEPLNKNIQNSLSKVQELRSKNIPTLPTSIKEEKLINPFLRCDDKDLQMIMRKKFNTDLSELNIFSALREWKDNF
jgi:hydroxyacylglutathione hydrolase